MRARIVFVVACLAAAGCRPASVEAVHQWLTAYAADDAEGMVAHTFSADQPLVRDAMAARATAPTSTLAMALPPKPLEHELVEIESKAPGRHTVLTVIQMKNPLPFVSKKVGQDLSDIPKQRPERRRFLAVQEGERWGVKLDLSAALARVEFVAAFERKLAARDVAGAKAMLEAVPKPPDEANALRTRDRLALALADRLAELEDKLAKRRRGFSCFAWVHGKDFGTDCFETAKACARARARAEEEHRDVRACAKAPSAHCFAGADGRHCYGDQRACLEASTHKGVVLELCRRVGTATTAR